MDEYVTGLHTYGPMATCEYARMGADAYTICVDIV